jgi:hypothetical protein
MMARARWDKHNAELAANPPPLSDADRVDRFLRDRKGQIAFVYDIANPKTRSVDTWVMRYSVKGRCDQFDLTRNGEFILTGGHKKCQNAMTPQIFHILRYN